MSYRVDHEKYSDEYERRAQLVLREREDSVDHERDMQCHEKETVKTHEKEGDSVSLLQLEELINGSHYHCTIGCGD